MIHYLEMNDFTTVIYRNLKYFHYAEPKNSKVVKEGSGPKLHYSEDENPPLLLFTVVSWYLTCPIRCNCLLDICTCLVWILFHADIKVN